MFICIDAKRVRHINIWTEGQWWLSFGRKLHLGDFCFAFAHQFSKISTVVCFTLKKRNKMILWYGSHLYLPLGFYPLSGEAGRTWMVCFCLFAALLRCSWRRALRVDIMVIWCTLGRDSSHLVNSIHHLIFLHTYLYKYTFVYM